MAKKKPPQPLGDPPIPTACVVPSGYSFVANGSAPGAQLVWDGFNWQPVPYPENPDGQVWTAGTNGPFWANK